MNNAVVVHVLKTEYPNIAEKVINRAEQLAEVIALSDFDRIGDVIAIFSDCLTGGKIEFADMYRICNFNTGEIEKLQTTYIIDVLIATILKLYSPDVFFGGATIPGLNRAISNQTGRHRNNTAIRIDRAVFYYNNNKKFKQQVDYSYQLVKERI